MAKIPSPCIDVCKFKRQGHCIGCSMTKAQKSLCKALEKDKHRIAFTQMLRQQQAALGKYKHWELAYDKKLRKAKMRPLWEKTAGAPFS